ncbi:YbaN family protein [Pseudooceanicola algae]|uniref:Inner membrane protein YbaN n=1 Tax=Pseudooceanicola algae TaxID=1537215 RepID=A0A418SBG5_9RHOB|nr:YbaN family protein [Pseudooceanicola algae]QPM91468.1 Inner membrane protein YbaN [Pseudooceanicola algae]
MRLIWLTFGCLSVALGVVGVALPLLPTVPFMLLAAFCFARSSERMHTWLVTHPRFGPAIRDWQENGAISLRAKRLSTVMIAGVYMVSLIMGLRPILLLIQGVTLALVLLFLWTRPSGPR